MTIGVREWLPANALENRRLKDKVAQAVALWAQAWFPTPALEVTRIVAVTGAAPKLADAAGWRLGQQSAAIHCPGRALERLTGWALGVRLSDQSSTEVDLQLLDRFEGRMLEDLLSKLGATLALPVTPRGRKGEDPFAGGGGALVSVSDGSSVLLTIALPLEAVVPTCRPAAPARRSPIRPQGIADAVGAMPVTMEVSLGGAEISVSDLRNLGLGDVLVLNAALSDPNPVLISRNGHLVAKARLADADGEIALVVHDA